MDNSADRGQDSFMASSEREYEKAQRVLAALKSVTLPETPYVSGRIPELEEALAASKALREAIVRCERELAELRARRTKADKQAWKIGLAINHMVLAIPNASQPLLLKLMGKTPKEQQARRGPKPKSGRIKPSLRRR